MILNSENKNNDLKRSLDKRELQGTYKKTKNVHMC